MDLEGLKEVLLETGLPVVYEQFQAKEYNDSPPPLPWIVFYETNSDNFFADNKVYLNIRDVTIELYTEHKDITVEKQLESILTENGIVFNTYDELIEDEGLYLHSIDVRIWWQGDING